jgi:hypothetical protein
MKGLNCEELGKVIHSHWEEFSDPIYVSVDGQRFDQHVSELALKFEHTFYKRFFPKDKFLAKLLRWQLENDIRCYVDEGKFSYKLQGKRMSGDFNTGLGNVILMVAMLYEWLEKTQIKCRLINNGDDAGFIIERKDYEKLLSGFEEYMLDYGFEMTIDPPVDVLEQLKFCQTQPVEVDGKWTMMRDHYVGRAKDARTTRVRYKKEFYVWASSVGASGLSMCGGVPVFQAMYQYYLKCGRGHTPSLCYVDPGSGRLRLAERMQKKISEISDSTRLSYHRAFGIHPDTQVLIENYYEMLNVVDFNPLVEDQDRQDLQYTPHGF